MKWYRLYKESSDSDFIIKDGVLERYTGKGGNVVIPDGVAEIGERAFSHENTYYTLKSIVIPNSVTKIEQNAFANCEELQKVKIGSGVKIIEFAAFASCKKLKSITIPDNVDKICKFAFYRCEQLTKVIVTNPEIKFEAGVGAFFGCFNLKVNPSDKILSKACVFGIGGLITSKGGGYNCSYPEYVRFNGGKEIHMRDLAGMISHHTIMRPLNDDWSGSGDYSMLCKAEQANPELFKQTLTKLLSGKKIDSWWDDTKGKWETDEKTLRKKNKDREEWQRNADMMNGL